MRPRMHALVTGANGFLGSHLVRHLLVGGHAVRCLVRPRSDAGLLSGLDAEMLAGDVTEPASLTAAVRGVDVVFHLAGIRRAPRREDFMRVNAQGTRNVCEAMATLGRRPRLVLAGSLAASGSSADRPRREEDPLLPEEWYGESKAEAERIAFSFSDRLEVTSVRPCRIAGPGDRENLTFFRVVKRGLKVHLLGKRRPLSMVDVDDVVELLVQAATRPEAVGEAFFAAGSRDTDLDEVQELIARELGVRPRTVLLPPPVLSALAGAADVASRVTGRHLPINRKLARQLLAPGWTCSIDKAERMLGWRPSRSLEHSVRRTAAWYKAQGWV